MLTTRRRGVLVLLLGRSPRCLSVGFGRLALMLLVGLVGLAAAASPATAATRASQGALASNPFAGSINLV